MRLECWVRSGCTLHLFCPKLGADLPAPYGHGHTGLTLALCADYPATSFFLLLM